MTIPLGRQDRLEPLPAEFIADPYQLAIPSDLVPGECELLVGIYLLSTGERLPLLTSDDRVSRDSFSLGFVEVLIP